MTRIIFRSVLLLLSFGLAGVVFAATPAQSQLPDPLTLKYALSLSDEPHPTLMLSKANIRSAEAQQAIVDSSTDAEVSLDGNLSYVEPLDTFSYLSHDDSSVGITVRKDLYDFGYHAAQSRAAEDTVSASKYAFLSARAQRRLIIMQRYFDVILADLKFTRYNEEMAVEYVHYDHMRKQRKVGDLSDYQVKKQQARYQQVRYLRVTAENDQRRTRALLAEALNHPGDLPSQLAKPDLSIIKRKLPDYDDLLALAFKHNYRLKELKEQLASAQQQITAARASDNPRLVGEIGAYDHARALGGYDKFHAGISIKMPLFDGDRTDALTAKAQAGLYRVQAQLKNTEYQIRQQVLDNWLLIQDLHARRQDLRVQSNFSDLNLDRSRALYEMEVTTDLGDSMVRVTQSEYLAAQADFQMIEAWIRLDILTGQLNLAQNKL